MSTSAESTNFKCPRCLLAICVHRSQSGTRVECPNCGANLTVPDYVERADLFDDLFDLPSDRKVASASAIVQNPKTENRAAKPLNSVPQRLAIPPESRSSTTPSPAKTDELELWPDDSASSSPEANQTIDELLPNLPAGGDPFAYDETSTLKVDGLAPEQSAPGSFYCRCSVCGSPLYAIDEQISQTVQCADCHSQIIIEKPKPSRAPDAWQQPAKIITGETSDDDFRLADPITRPKRQFEVDPGFGLEQVTDDLLAPHQLPSIAQPSRPKVAPKTLPGQPASTDKPSPAATGPTPSPTSVRTINDAAQVAPSQQVTWKRIANLELSSDLELIIRTVVAVVFLAISYAMFQSVFSTWQRQDLNPGERFTQWIVPMLVGMAFWLAAAWLVAVTMAVLMRSIANGNTKVNEWVGFSPSEWLGSFLMVAFSGWASSVPGGLASYVLSNLTGLFLLFPLGCVLSVFILFPVLLISSFANESVFNIFSTSVVRSLSVRASSWMVAYRWIGLTLGIFVVGILVVMIPGLLFSIIGAALHVVAATMLACLIGLQAQSILSGQRNF